MSQALAAAKKVFYDDTGMDPVRVQSIVDKGLAGCDEGELYLERTVSENLVLREKKIASSFEISQGYGIRYTSGEKMAFRPSSTLDEKSIIRDAAIVRSIRGQSEGSIIVPKKDIIVPANRGSLYLSDNPLFGFSAQDKSKLVRDVNAYLRNLDPRVKDVTVALNLEYKIVQIVRPDAAPVADIRPLVRFDVSTTVAEGARRERGSSSTGGRIDCSVVFNEASWKNVASEALQRALVLLRAQPAPPGEMTVVAGAGWPGVLLHEAVGHGLEGDFNRKGTSNFTGRIGQRVASPGVTVVDQGDIPDRRGSLNVDDEGVPTQRTVLIEDGILVGYMQDRTNARLMGVPTTGNGRRESYQHPPLPRMTNTFAESGKYSPAEIIESVKTGIYAPGFSGGQVDITSGKFVFDMSEAYMIRNGKVQWDEAISGATLIGNGPDIMNKIGMVGNDSKLDPGMGTCGKAGQGVPVGVGQPTLRIDGITVGGRG